MNLITRESTDAFVKGLEYTSGDTKVEAIHNYTKLFYHNVLIASLEFKKDNTVILCLSNGGFNTHSACNKIRSIVDKFDDTVEVYLFRDTIFWKRGGKIHIFDEQNCILTF